MTKLEAINEMLGEINEAPVNSIDNPRTEEASLALTILDTTLKDTLRQGYNFNTDIDVEFEPDSDGQVSFGTDMLRVEFDRTLNLSTITPAVRGTTCYDSQNHTAVFSSTIYCSHVVRLLDWEDCPETCQRYVTLRAARVFKARVTGSNLGVMSASIEETQAKHELNRDAMFHKHSNMLDSPSTYEAVGRWIPGRGPWR